MSDDERVARVTEHEAKLWSVWNVLSPDQFVLMIADEIVRLEDLVRAHGGDPEPVQGIAEW